MKLLLATDGGGDCVVSVLPISWRQQCHCFTHTQGKKSTHTHTQTPHSGRPYVYRWKYRLITSKERSFQHLCAPNFSTDLNQIYYLWFFFHSLHKIRALSLQLFICVCLSLQHSFTVLVFIFKLFSLYCFVSFICFFQIDSLRFICSESRPLSLSFTATWKCIAENCTHTHFEHNVIKQIRRIFYIYPVLPFSSS